ncbi:MAG: hypothetical protein J6C59_06215 [Muribaculaceae bacterium]|nr:hypothetical protein [Muribaculaceae bacterium]
MRLLKLTQFTLLIVCILAGLPISAFCQNPNMRYMRHVETASKEMMPAVIHKPLSAKSNRVSTIKGQIVMTYDSDLPDSIKNAINMAKGMWESRLVCKQPIYVNVVFEPQAQNIAMISDVCCYGEGDFRGCPTSLLSQLNDAEYCDPASPDGIILLNSNLSWNCDINTHVADENNLTTMILRGIARTLGLGSSVTQKTESKIDFYFGWPTYFDKLLRNQNVWLHSMDGNSAEMRNFITSDNVVIDTPSSTYKVYAPSVYDPGKSLYYIEGRKSIMSNSLGQGHIPQEIDDYTVDILNAIGWNIPLNAGNIKCDNISDNNNISAYIPHTFSIDKAEGDVISDYNWSFQLKDDSGVYTTVSKGSASGFIIAEISSPHGYYVNSAGEMEGRIECIYTLNGKQKRASSDLSLDLKPVILSINNLEVHENQEDYYFWLTFELNYRGSNKVYICVSDEESPYITRNEFYEPLLAHITTTQMSTTCYSWVDIDINNQYGKTTKTLEFAPIQEALEKIPSSGIDDINSTYGTTARLIVIKLDGSVLYDGPESNFSKEQLPGGLYIMKTMMPDGSSNVTKIMVQ